MTHASTSADVALLAERVRDARARRTTLRIVAGGSWLDAGRPCSATAQLETGGLTGIVTYEPGDLTLTARAGTALSDIARITAGEDQWLTLDPHGAQSGATLGASVATASYGPLASAFGPPRDHVLGCEFVSGTGDVVRAGGKVVKNVAGFDLVRLVTGAWGTIGAITEVTVRLRARPEVDRTLAVALNGVAPQSAAEVAWRWLRTSEYTPIAAELLSRTVARSLGMGGASLLIRLGGNEALVRAAEGAVGTLGEWSVVNDAIWSVLASSEPAAAVVVRASALPSRIGTLWARAERMAEDGGGYAHATLSRGVVRCVMPMPTSAESLDEVRAALSGLAADVTIAGERMPATLWSAISRPRSSDALATQVRRAFDPDHVMNPGILGAP